jgi:hypothetical protein
MMQKINDILNSDCPYTLIANYQSPKNTAQNYTYDLNLDNLYCKTIIALQKSFLKGPKAAVFIGKKAYDSLLRRGVLIK